MGIFKRGRPSQQTPPAKSGLYYLRNKRTGDVDYVGETSNLKRRKAEHNYRLQKIQQARSRIHP